MNRIRKEVDILLKSALVTGDDKDVLMIGYQNPNGEIGYKFKGITPLHTYLIVQELSKKDFPDNTQRYRLLSVQEIYNHTKEDTPEGKMLRSVETGGFSVVGEVFSEKELLIDPLLIGDSDTLGFYSDKKLQLTPEMIKDISDKTEHVGKMLSEFGRLTVESDDILGDDYLHCDELGFGVVGCAYMHDNPDDNMLIMASGKPDYNIKESVIVVKKTSDNADFLKDGALTKL